jgi:hypothetical protein
MVIRQGNDCVAVEAVDYVADHLPAAGDVELSVAVSSAGFSGQVWDSVPRCPIEPAFRAPRIPG